MHMNTRILLLRFSGFSVVGLIVTLLSLLLTYLFIGILKTPLYMSYALIYLLSIFASYTLNLNFVFKVKKTPKNIFTFYLIYGSSMLIGLVTLKLYKIIIPLDDWLLAYLVLPVTLTWNFIMLSLLLKEGLKNGE